MLQALLQCLQGLPGAQTRSMVLDGIPMEMGSGRDSLPPQSLPPTPSALVAVQKVFLEIPKGCCGIFVFLHLAGC